MTNVISLDSRRPKPKPFEYTITVYHGGEDGMYFSLSGLDDSKEDMALLLGDLLEATQSVEEVMNEL